MNEKKLVVFVFPSSTFVDIQNNHFKEEIDENFEVSSVFDSIIQKRYLDNGYDFIVVNYFNQQISGITIEPKKVIFTDVDQEEYYKDNDKLAERYLKLAQQIEPKMYSEIKVGGYHLGDCVDAFAHAVNCINPVVSIDKELTNTFGNYVFDEKFENYNENYEFYNEIKLRNSNIKNSNLK